MPYNYQADVCQLIAKRYDTKSNVKSGRFQSQLGASYVSSHTEELWYNETVCLWMTIYEENRRTKYSKCDEFIKMVKSMLKCFGFIEPSSGPYDREKLLLEQQWMFL